ncbi:hypothetical protein BRADI_1g22231v3 [Brachypodium distachyon]|uniref:Secreted protein n=1 Tax=Brachypodium distachyon TaxID=15368 RepID=I1GSL9_BRADI|nr:hypothetical protein BRADI_1g22231v3 [Brachypodium distachyon]
MRPSSSAKALRACFLLALLVGAMAQTASAGRRQPASLIRSSKSSALSRAHVDSFVEDAPDLPDFPPGSDPIDDDAPDQPESPPGPVIVDDDGPVLPMVARTSELEEPAPVPAPELQRGEDFDPRDPDSAPVTN